MVKKDAHPRSRKAEQLNRQTNHERRKNDNKINKNRKTKPKLERFKLFNKDFKPVQKNDPLTWEIKNGFMCSKSGLLGTDSSFTKMSWENRTNEAVYNAFCNILENKDLWCSVDRYGLMKPTKNIKLLDGSKVDKPEWKTTEKWLHWDMNPWKALKHEKEHLDVSNFNFITENNQNVFIK